VYNLNIGENYGLNYNHWTLTTEYANFDADGTFSSGSHDTLYKSMVDGWPDALQCVKEGKLKGNIFYLQEVKPDLITYRNPHLIQIRYVSFNSDRTWNGHGTKDEFYDDCVGKTIDELIAEG